MPIVFSGAICLGLAVAWLIRFFLEKLKSVTPKLLVTIALIMTGTVTVQFGAIFNSFEISRWAYFIGLFVGILIYPLLRRLDNILSQKEK